MRVGWLLDETVFDSYHDEIASAILRNGFDFKSANRPRPPYGWEDAEFAYRDAFPAGACVVTHADIGLVARVRSDARWLPGVFATVPHFFCSSYYPHFQEFLLNRDHAMLPFSELSSRAAELFDRFGLNGQVFVRPDSPLKLFTGLIVSRSTLAKDLEFMSFYEFPQDSLVVVSSPKSIVNEWRFVIAGGEIVACSWYKDGTNTSVRAGASQKAISFAETVLTANYNPDPAWVLDICETADGGLHLLEIGGFSFSNLYACDKDAVVTAVSQLAWQAHEESTRLP